MDLWGKRRCCLGPPSKVMVRVMAIMMAIVMILAIEMVMEGDVRGHTCLGGSDSSTRGRFLTAELDSTAELSLLSFQMDTGGSLWKHSE